METKTELKTFLVNHQCPVCGSGFMHQTGIQLTSTPPKYHHKCQNQQCGHEALFTKKYPCTEHEVIEPKQQKANPIPKQSELKK